MAEMVILCVIYHNKKNKRIFTILLIIPTKSNQTLCCRIPFVSNKNIKDLVTFRMSSPRWSSVLTLTSLSPTLALPMEKGTTGRRWCSKPGKGTHGAWAPLDVDRCPLAPVLIPTPPFFFLWPWFKCVVYSHHLTSPLSFIHSSESTTWWMTDFFLIVWEHWCLELRSSFDRITVITVLLQKIP